MALGDKGVKKFAAAFENETTSPELVVKFVSIPSQTNTPIAHYVCCGIQARTALQRMALSATPSSDPKLDSTTTSIVNAILDRIAVHVRDVYWEGFYSELSNDQEGVKRACVALCSVVMDRWFYDLEYVLYQCFQKSQRLIRNFGFTSGFTHFLSKEIDLWSLFYGNISNSSLETGSRDPTRILECQVLGAWEYP